MIQQNQMCCLCNEYHPNGKHYSCNICQRGYSGDCIAKHRDILENPIVHSGNFYCGDRQTDCYVDIEEAQEILGDSDEVRQYIHYDCCGKHEFVYNDELDDYICPICKDVFTCDNCRVDCLDENDRQCWICPDCADEAEAISGSIASTTNNLSANSSQSPNQRR